MVGGRKKECCQTILTLLGMVLLAPEEGAVAQHPARTAVAREQRSWVVGGVGRHRSNN